MNKTMRCVMLSKPMRSALLYVRAVKVVREWPMDIKDSTIRRLRREGYLTVEVVKWHVHPASAVEWSRITDRLTPKGKEAICNAGD